MNKKTVEHLNGHDHELEEKIFEMYREFKRSNKDVCDKCKKHANIKNAEHPVSLFGVGEDFRNEKYKVIFVGKTVLSGWEDDPIDPVSEFIDARKSGKEELFLPFWSTTSFWQCIKEICWELWRIADAEGMWKKIAITNLIKCSTSEETDTTPHILIENCVLEAGFFEEEVKIIQPTHIIFFTGPKYEVHQKTPFSLR